jgi:hypothetical protein
MPYYRIGGLMAHIKLSGKAAKNPPAPCCAPIQLDGKTVACAAISGFLCDWETGPGTTCSKAVCAAHALQIGPDRHLCSEHAARRFERPEGLF